MSYQVLARKWRPQRFEDVAGQEHVTTTLRNAITQQRIAHAFLFSGPRGVGKTTVARLLAKALNCAEGPTGEPCGRCASCTEVTAGSALDVVEIDGASNTGVENIRDLNENVRYRPASSRFKVYIIDEVHMLSTAAFNALLKTLEEPPDHVKFIFATTEVHKLPQTVISRCQRYEFKRIGMPDLLERLKRITVDESVAASDAALFAIAREADGSMRDAQSLLDQVIVFAGKTLGESDVQGALGVADRTILHRVTEAILRRDPAPCLRAVEELTRYGYEVPRFCRDLVQQFRNLTVAALFTDPTMLTDLPDHEAQETMRQAKLRAPEDLQRLFRVAQVGTEEVRKSALPKLVLEMTLVKMATMPDAPPVEDLLLRLEEMERRLAVGGGGEPPGGRGLDVRSRPSAAAPITRADGAPPSPRAETVRGWSAFVAAAQAKGLRMFLLGSRVLEESADRLHIGLATELAEQTLRPQLGMLAELVAAAYGGPRRIELSVARTAEPSNATPASARTRELAERARSSPTVRSALEVLGGEITDVRPRSRGGEP
ncbi:MAG: DNA polymerase III subunit gamma/tau [Deltaproteobacteria bacterium]|nr:DNA polymerase III subunit gamma/tau [Deltaproteobacteria bacterium]